MDCCAVAWSMHKCQQYNGVTAWAKAAASQTSYMLLPWGQPSLWLLILLGRVHGCSGVQRYDCLLLWNYLFLLLGSDCLLLWEDWLTPLEWLTACSERHASFAIWTCSWLLCDWWVSRACHSSGTSDCLCTAVRFMAQSCRRAISDYSAALVAGADVRCATSVRVHKRAVADYSGKFPQCISYIFLHLPIACNFFSYLLICI